MDKKNIFDALNKELTFYRTRLFLIFTYAIGLEVLLITGQIIIFTNYPIITNVAYTVVFICMVLFVYIFHKTYTVRIYRIRWARNKLIKEMGYTDTLFPPPTGSINYDPKNPIPMRKLIFSLSPSMQFVYVVLLLALLGIIITWTGAPIYQHIVF